MSNYADNNVLYAFESNLEEIKTHLIEDLTKIPKWFTENFMILNPYRCHYMCLGKDNVSGMLKFCDEELEASILEKSKE